MDILFVGDTGPNSSSRHYYTSLVRLGHRAVAFDPRYFRARSLAGRLAQRYRGGPSTSLRLQIANELQALCRSRKFDRIFVMSETFVSAQTIEAIRDEASRPNLKIFFHSHDNVFAPGICKPIDFAATLVAYDAVFTTKSQNVTKYRVLGQGHAYFVPSAFEPSIHRPIARGQKTFPVSFIGTYDRSRLPYLESIGWENLHVWGDRWNRCRVPKNARARIEARAIYGDEFAEATSRSEIALGLLREEVGDRHTQRTFEIPACGTLQLAPRTEEILSFFDEDREIVCFGMPDELRDKARFYLAHPSAQRAIARAGWRRCLADGHTYLDRTRQILELVDGLG